MRGVKVIFWYYIFSVNLVDFFFFRIRVRLLGVFKGFVVLDLIRCFLVCLRKKFVGSYGYFFFNIFRKINVDKRLREGFICLFFFSFIWFVGSIRFVFFRVVGVLKLLLV